MALDEDAAEKKVSTKREDIMPRMAMLLAVLCIAAAPVIATTNASAQKEADKPDKTDKADKADKATSKPESDQADKFDLDKIMKGIKDMVDKTVKEEDKPAPPK